MRMQKYKIGFFIGRFQPLHKGHIHLIKRSLYYVESLIIGIGSVGVVNSDNFLSYDQRKTMLQTAVAKEKFSRKIRTIVPLKDFHNDKLWLEDCLKQAGKFDVIIGNNEWTNGIFERAGYKILRLGFYKRYLYEGVKIRKLMKDGKKWDDRVPGYIVPLIHDFIV